MESKGGMNELMGAHSSTNYIDTTSGAKPSPSPGITNISHNGPRFVYGVCGLSLPYPAKPLPLCKATLLRPGDCFNSLESRGV